MLAAIGQKGIPVLWVYRWARTSWRGDLDREALKVFETTRADIYSELDRPVYI